MIVVVVVVVVVAETRCFSVSWVFEVFTRRIWQKRNKKFGTLATFLSMASQEWKLPGVSSRFHGGCHGVPSFL